MVVIMTWWWSSSCGCCYHSFLHAKNRWANGGEWRCILQWQDFVIF
jgi:hypothetical protein